MYRVDKLREPHQIVAGYILPVLLLLQCFNLSVEAGNTNINEKSETSSSPDFKIPLCSNLLLGQYVCDEPIIDSKTQQAKNCDQETRTVVVTCRTAPNITCRGESKNESQKFTRHLPCKWTNGHSFETALLLSIFLGMFGVDRFYLGYPAIGLLKFSTLGFMFLGQLIDILLIATQVVKPADGSDYVIDCYGAVLTRLSMDNETYIKPPNY
ncbi:TM2 domain-containing protein CG10795 [Octopus bimaculoides]|nr:TM2 domain-containing protein CG10795 [Octopus bimaculoides]|eukprot:XP_014789354.1 PREDICTED: TM2 domain-containing protein CG10795-like [Octopus bimaculoides]